MKKKLLIIIPLLLLTAVLSFIYLRSRDTVNAGDILVKSSAGEMTLTFDNINLSHVSGQITNKKAETKDIDSNGLAISEIPSLAGINDYSGITVYADDEYSAYISAEEASESDKAWLIKNDESIRLVVFGDPDSKRDVKNVVRIEIK